MSEPSGKPKATFRPMTADEQALARALKGGSFMAVKKGHFDSDFAIDIKERAGRARPQISEKQAAMLRQLVTKYRSKIDPKEVPPAEQHLLNPPPKKTQGRRREPTIGEDIQLAQARRERDEWERRSNEFQAERDLARREFEQAQHQLDVLREENADLRRQQQRLGALSGSGLLWLINRVVFHPRGFALALHTESDGRVTGWSIQGAGKEVWKFSDADDDASFAAAEKTLNEARQQAQATKQNEEPK